MRISTARSMERERLRRFVQYWDRLLKAADRVLCHFVYEVDH